MKYRFVFIALFVHAEYDVLHAVLCQEGIVFAQYAGCIGDEIGIDGSIELFHAPFAEIVDYCFC